MSERIQKVLAQHGLGSRREVERWIAEGRIRINGVRAQTGDRYTEGDRVELDERDITRRLERTTTAQVIAYHKPQGQPISREDVRSARSPEVDEARVARESASETAEERLPVLRGSRWLAINPMHAGDSGLLLFTNDGALSYALTRQKKQIPTAYMVRVQVRGGAASAPVMPTTLRLDDGTVEFTEVTVSTGGPEGENESGNVWYKVVLPRADKRAAVRALFASHNLSVSRVMQVAFGDIALTRDMPRSRHVALKPAQIEHLYTLAQLPLPANALSTVARLKRSKPRHQTGEAGEPEERHTATRSRKPPNASAPRAAQSRRGPASRTGARPTGPGSAPRTRRK